MFSDSHPMTPRWMLMKWYEYVWFPPRSDFHISLPEYQCFDGQCSVFGSCWERQCSCMKVNIKQGSCHFVKYVMVNRVSASCQGTSFGGNYHFLNSWARRTPRRILHDVFSIRRLNIVQDSVSGCDWLWDWEWFWPCADTWRNWSGDDNNVFNYWCIVYEFSGCFSFTRDLADKPLMLSISMWAPGILYDCILTWSAWPGFPLKADQERSWLSKHADEWVSEDNIDTSCNVLMVCDCCIKDVRLSCAERRTRSAWHASFRVLWI